MTVSAGVHPAETARHETARKESAAHTRGVETARHGIGGKSRVW